MDTDEARKVRLGFSQLMMQYPTYKAGSDVIAAVRQYDLAVCYTPAFSIVISPSGPLDLLSFSFNVN